MISLVLSTPNAGSARVLSFDQVQELHHLTLSKDRRAARLLQRLSLVNVAATVLIAVALHIAIPENGFETFQAYGREALAAFVAGGFFGAFVYGTRRSAVVMRIRGLRPKFRTTWPILIALAASAAGLMAGASRFASGMAAVW